MIRRRRVHRSAALLWPSKQDHEEPDLADYDRGVAFIQKWHSKGGKVLVHCKAGHGRCGIHTVQQ